MQNLFELTRVLSELKVEIRCYGHNRFGFWLNGVELRRRASPATISRDLSHILKTEAIKLENRRRAEWPKSNQA